MPDNVAQAEEGRQQILCLRSFASYHDVMTPTNTPHSVSCPCGASLQIDPNETTQELACPECGMMLEVAIAIDSRTKRVRLGILVKDASISSRRSKGKGQEIHTAKCVCGAQITIESGGMDAFHSCSACGADYTASFKKPKGDGMSTLVLRAVTASPMAKTTKHPPPAKTTKIVPPAPKLPAKPPPPVLGPSAAGLAAKEKFLQMAKSEVGAQELADNRIHCFCRAPLTLKEAYHREIVKCDECGTAFRIFEAIHPKTGEAMVVMIPRG